MGYRQLSLAAEFRFRIKASFLAAAVLALTAHRLPAEPSESPLQLVADMAYNEIQDRALQSCWIYHIEHTVDGQTKSEQQVESVDGPVFRVLAINSRQLTDFQEKEENARLMHLLASPSEQRKAKQLHEQDEERLQRLTALMPKAFLYEFIGMEGSLIKLRFSPNPDFKPPTFESRAFADLAGTLEINASQKRLVRLDGQLIHQVDFGLGLLGRIEKGGTFVIERTPVSSTHWKTSRVSVHVTGHIIVFKSISKQQDERRSDFHPLPEGTTLAQAEALLNQTDGHGSPGR